MLVSRSSWRRRVRPKPIFTDLCAANPRHEGICSNSSALLEAYGVVALNSFAMLSSIQHGRQRASRVLIDLSHRPRDISRRWNSYLNRVLLRQNQLIVTMIIILFTPTYDKNKFRHAPVRVDAL